MKKPGLFQRFLLRLMSRSIRSEHRERVKVVQPRIEKVETKTRALEERAKTVVAVPDRWVRMQDEYDQAEREATRPTAHA